MLHGYGNAYGYNRRRFFRLYSLRPWRWLWRQETNQRLPRFLDGFQRRVRHIHFDRDGDVLSGIGFGVILTSLGQREKSGQRKEQQDHREAFRQRLPI